mmetsp:Transcript_99348/g.289947  ORF Transcript_99348/g.289947 Transcript_99348/m.289947 type:complete len:647 (+) Transcript_99348:115-2055(+)
MDVRASNFEQALEEIQAALSQAEFVALDLELTGVQAANETDDYADHASERLEKSCRIVECYAPIQLGITICSQERKLSSYSIMMAPESTFLCDMSSLKFLRRHNVDLNLWVDEGVRYVSREEAALPVGPSICQDDLLDPLLRLQEQAHGTAFLCQASQLRAGRRGGLDLNAWVQAQEEALGELDSARFSSAPSSGSADPSDLACRQAGLPRLWRVLKESQRPLVVHCGFLDVLFLLAAFEQRVLPRDPMLLAQLVLECFPCGVYDTALLHETVGDLRLCPLGLHSFVKSAREHQRRRGAALHFELDELTGQRYGNALDCEGLELTHEAGYDSFLTAVLFGHLQDAYRQHLPKSVNRFYLFKSTDCLNLGTAAVGKNVATKVYDREQLVVAELKDEDARQNTANRISEARRSDREHAFFYRKMDENALLIPGCHKGQLVQLSAKLPGVTWIDFYKWQQNARNVRTVRPPDMDRRFSGVVKSFSPRQGYGFISCVECSRIYNCGDVFLHQRQATGFQEGQYVSFHVACNNKGQPQGQDLKEVWFTGVVRTTPSSCRAGSIFCPGTFRACSTNIHLCEGQLDDCQVGEHVSFTMAFRQGQFVVYKIRRVHPTAQPGTRLLDDHHTHAYNCESTPVLGDHQITRSNFFGG